MYYNSSYYNCLNIKQDYGAYGNGILSEGFVLPLGWGLSKSMADARNPAGETSYKKLVVYANGDREVFTNSYYLVTYEHMQVCACVYTCGLNGFKYAMLWKQYFNLIFFKSIINIC